jgi:hypothetical protein
MAKLKLEFIKVLPKFVSLVEGELIKRIIWVVRSYTILNPNLLVIFNQ